MSPADLTVFILIAALGSFVQALSGFALGLIMLGSVTLLQLAPIPFTAAVISIVSLVNGGWVLARHPRDVHWPSVVWITAALVPAVALGLAWLAHLDASTPVLLRRLAGAVILGAGVVLMLRPHPRPRPAGRIANVVSGALGGLLGGLFSTAGPPVVFHLYRQPWTSVRIRSTLLTVFVLSTLARITLQSARGELRFTMVETALYCVLPVVLAAQWGARLAPRIGPLPMRRFAFALLALTGAGLLLPTTPRDDSVTLATAIPADITHARRASATLPSVERSPAVAGTVPPPSAASPP
jgi:uncharacterized membrane protein YfcA